MAALSGPYTQSLSTTGGKTDCSVGPGVGRGLITVHPAGALVSSLFACVGVESGFSVVGEDSARTGDWAALEASLTASASGVCVVVLPWQLAVTSVKSVKKKNNRFNILFPLRSYALR